MGDGDNTMALVVVTSNNKNIYMCALVHAQ